MAQIGAIMLSKKEQKVVDDAISIIQNKARKSDLLATTSQAAKDYCRLQLAMSEREKFGVLFLDNQHSLIEFDIMFQGSISSCEVQPREIARKALLLNCSCILICHNHPSNCLEASNADKNITKRLVEALDLFNIKVLDHVIVTKTGTLSFAETGLL